MKQTKKESPMEKLTAGYEDFIKKKEVVKGKSAFTKVIKKAAKPKQRGSK